MPKSSKPTDKTESVLGIVPFDQPKPLHTELAPYTLMHPVTREEKRITEEFHKQTLVMEGTAEKTIFGQGEIGDIHESAQFVFAESVSSIFEIRLEAQGTEYQAYVDEFTKLTAQSLAKCLYGSVTVGSAAIGAEISRSLYPSPEPMSLRKWLFG